MKRNDKIIHYEGLN
ncbi:TPA: hypothetical protein NV710_002315 [Escherichia coli]|nr:hypothetical protein [Escherichia coli]